MRLFVPLDIYIILFSNRDKEWVKTVSYFFLICAFQAINDSALTA